MHIYLIFNIEYEELQLQLREGDVLAVPGGWGGESILNPQK